MVSIETVRNVPYLVRY